MTRSMTGTASGVTSIRPAQLSTNSMRAKGGKAFGSTEHASARMPCLGFGSRTRIASNGVGWSRDQCRAVRSSSHERMPTRRRISLRLLIRRGRKSCSRRKWSGVISAVLALRRAIE